MNRYIHRDHQGFTLVELVLVLMITGIVAAYLSVRFLNVGNDAQQKVTDSVASALSVAAASNYRLAKAGASAAISVSNCNQISNALDAGDFPAGYSITSSAISGSGTKANCTLTHSSSGTSQTFIGIGA